MSDFIELTKRSFRRPSNGSEFDYGKLPPQAKELEEAVLGAIMIEDTAINEVINLLNQDSFYVDAHQRIWRAIHMLYTANAKIDLLTVTEQLRKNGELDAAGGPYYVAQLTNKVGSSANIEDHARIVSEKYLKRQLITISTQIIQDGYEDTADAFESYDRALTLLDRLNTQMNRGQAKTFFQIANHTAEQIKKAGASASHITGVATFISEIDRVTGGWQPTDLIIIGARPSMGKTALVLDMARKQVKQAIPVGVFSLEMSSTQLTQRLISSETQIPLSSIRSGTLHDNQWQHFEQSMAEIQQWPLHIEDNAFHINQIVATAKIWKLKFNIQALYIDYIQLAIAASLNKNSNREQDVSAISRTLKQLAKQLDIPVIALSQLSRTCESRADKRPLLSDLRESGAIEQDADIVLFPYRDEYYNENTDAKGLCELDFAKNRNGATGKTANDIYFDMATQRFLNNNPF